MTIPTSATGLLAGASGTYNDLIREHVELRSPDGRQIVVSYARPLGNFRGDVRLARITFQ